MTQHKDFSQWKHIHHETVKFDSCHTAVKISMSNWFEFRIFLLLDWLSSNALKPTLPFFYLTHNWTSREEIHAFLKGINTRRTQQTRPEYKFQFKCWWLLFYQHIQKRKNLFVFLSYLINIFICIIGKLNMHRTC